MSCSTPIDAVAPALGLPPLALYVHVPWCLRKCPYCDFNSYRSGPEPPEMRYVEALLRDLSAEAAFSQGRALGSIFIGGGTPSLFSGEAIRRLIDGVRAQLPLADDVEITLEANPGAADTRRFHEYRRAGVNRLSLGVQSFRDAELERIGRVHDAGQALEAVGAARAAGFETVNIDIMYGLPRDAVGGGLADLRRALECEPEHLSWYQLTLEPGTAFHRRPPSLPAEPAVLELEARGRSLLAAAGFERYEISAYARPGKRCGHNLNYWEFGDYLGIGAGAHGKLTLVEGGCIVRRSRQRNPNTYMRLAGQPGVATTERIDAGRELVLEYLMNALRLVAGTGISELETRTGTAVETIAAGIAEARRLGWLASDTERLVATTMGLQQLNRLLLLFC